jgi:hypothetical protein
VCNVNGTSGAISLDNENIAEQEVAVVVALKVRVLRPSRKVDPLCSYMAHKINSIDLDWEGRPSEDDVSYA